MPTEYSNECYCGQTINAGSVMESSSDVLVNGCSMLCGGNASEYCGGSNRLDMYQINGDTAAPTPTGPITVQTGVDFSYVGCYSDSVSSRALTGRANPGVASENTVEQCASECTAFAYFGVEYGSECYCGSTITGGSALVAGSTPAMTGCDMVCSGNATEYCGGPNRINIYNYMATSSSTASSAAPTSTSPVHVQRVGDYAYQGCWNDVAQTSNIRTLSGPAYSNPGMTVEMCAAQCAGYAWMGVEYGQEW